MANFKYSKLADWLRGEIEGGTFSAGSKIPTEVELSNRFSASRQTVRQALALLEKENYLFKVQGSGTFVKKRVISNNPLPIHISSGNSKTINVIMNDPGNYIFTNVLRGIHDALHEHGYTMNLNISSTHVFQERQSLECILKNGSNGLIIEPARTGLPLLNRSLFQEISERIPCVFIHASFAELNIPSVTVDNFSIFAKLTKLLIDKGHTKIAAFCKCDEQTSIERYQGYAEEMMKNGLEFNEKYTTWYTYDTFPFLFTDKNATNVLNRIKDCTAVLCHNDLLAGSFIQFLTRHGISVPNDISVVGIDDYLDYSPAIPLTTAIHPKEKLGRTAVEILMKRISGESQDLNCTFDMEIVERASVRDFTKRSSYHF